MRAAICVIALFWGQCALAFDLQLPANAKLVAQRDSVLGSYAAPIKPFDGASVPTQIIEGRVEREVWSIISPDLTPLQVMEPLRDQLAKAGHEIVLDCDHLHCGGFDFRFAIEVFPAPNMYVNIRSFRFLTALKGNESGAPEALTLLVSATPTSTLVQIIFAGPASATPRIFSEGAELHALPKIPDGPFAQTLAEEGRIILDGLEFNAGTAKLGAQSHEALQALAAFMQARPDVDVILVGHAASDPALDKNINLSRRRAQSVRNQLIDRYDINPAQIKAEGVGHLAPISSNSDPEGRDTNSRVEAILFPAKQ